MASRLAALTVVVCTWIVVGSIAPAHANSRRQVAVIALADDAPAEAFANAMGTILVNHTTLGPLEQGSLIGALVGEFLDENRDPIASAEVTRVRAESALANFGFPVAIATAQAGHESLHTAVPSTQAVTLYSDLALVIAKAKLGENQGAEATRFFGLVHALTPNRRLDAALQLPEVVQAYEAARTNPGGPAQLIVKGTGRIWIDGKDHGEHARPITLPSGLHVVWLTGPDRETLAKQVLVEAGKDNVVDIGNAPASTRLKVQRARVALRNAADPTTRALAMQHLARLLGVHDAVVITMPAGKLIVQTWHDKAEGGLLPGFSAHRLVEGEKPLELLSPLAPPLAEEEPPPLVRVPLAPKPWYRRRSIQASIAFGVVATVLGSWMISRAIGDGTVGVVTDVENALSNRGGR